MWTALPSFHRANRFPHELLDGLRAEKNSWRTSAYPVHADGSWPSAVPNETEWKKASADFRNWIDELSILSEGRDLDREIENTHANQGKRNYSVAIFSGKP